MISCESPIEYEGVSYEFYEILPVRSLAEPKHKRGRY